MPGNSFIDPKTQAYLDDQVRRCPYRVWVHNGTPIDRAAWKTLEGGHSNSTKTVYLFSDPDEAMLFKLMHGGEKQS